MNPYGLDKRQAGLLETIMYSPGKYSGATLNELVSRGLVTQAADGKYMVWSYIRDEWQMWLNSQTDLDTDDNGQPYNGVGV